MLPSGSVPKVRPAGDSVAAGPPWPAARIAGQQPSVTKPVTSAFAGQALREKILKGPLPGKCVQAENLSSGAGRPGPDPSGASTLQHHLVNVAPRPGLAGLERAHDGVMGLVEMPGGVFVLGGVTATHVPAAQAQPEMNPAVARLEAFLAASSAGMNFPDHFHVRASLCHGHISRVDLSLPAANAPPPPRAAAPSYAKKGLAERALLRAAQCPSGPGAQ